MNRRTWNPIALTLTSVATLSALLLSGCAPGFETNLAEYDSRPPATSDPLTAEDRRRWDAAERSEVQVEPVLESEFEREFFLDDVTEQKPKHTEDELAEEAEKIYRARQAKSPGSAPAKVPPTPATAAAPNTPSTAPGAAQTSGQGPGTAPKAVPAPKPLPGTVAPQPPAVARPVRPAPSFRSAFCESLNVTSATARTDISHLYNTTATSTTAMPSKELAASDPQDKKNRFVCLILPMAIRMNEEVFRMRIEVLRLQAKTKKGEALTQQDQEWLIDMNKTYGVKEAGNFVELLKRVDIVPLPLLLAQAAIESGWGTSRATQDLKNLFGIHAVRGQKCKTGYDTNNACVRQFESLEASVSAYLQLINSGMYYPKFREARAAMRKSGESLDSVKLLATLGRYNETPVQYIRNVREIMTGSNKLTQFVFKEDAVKLKAL